MSPNQATVQSQNYNPKQNLLVNLLISLIALLLMPVLIDAGLRYALGILTPDAVYRRPDVPQVYTLKPNLNIVDGLHYGDLSKKGEVGAESWPRTLITDAYGYRNEGIPPLIDTLLLGDSFGYAFSDQQATLSAYLRGCDRTLYNLSVPAHGPWQEYATLILEKPRLNTQPDAVVLWLLFNANDMEDPYLPLYAADLRRLQQEADNANLLDRFLKYAESSPAVSLLSGTTLRDPTGGSLTFEGDRRIYAAHYLEAAARTPGDITSLPTYPALQETFNAMASEARQDDLQVVVVIVPSKEEIYHQGALSGFGAVIGDLAAQHDMPVIDLGPVFLEHAANSETIYYDQDTHWNEAGQQLAADLICQQLAGPD
jgi:hypothetical protein